MSPRGSLSTSSVPGKSSLFQGVKVELSVEKLTVVDLLDSFYTRSMVPLNYNQLYYFYQIADTGSIAAASRKVLISSPALSMQLKELEESLGAALFIRSGKKLILTDTGSIVYEYAKDIFKLGHELKDTIGDRGNERERPRIEIGCQDTIAKTLADELIAFLIEEKKCKVTLREGNREQLVELQKEFKLDLILTNSVPQIQNDYILETKLISREELIIVASPKLKLSKGSWPKNLSGAPFILPTFHSSTRQRIDSFFEGKKIAIDIVAEVEDKATEIDLALKGFGCMTVTKGSILPHLKAKTLVEIGALKGQYEEVWMILGKRKILNPLAIFAMKNFVK
jgi:LysR family transcriptional regulator, transcriptional activator of nhaA